MKQCIDCGGEVKNRLKTVLRCRRCYLRRVSDPSTRPWKPGRKKGSIPWNKGVRSPGVRNAGTWGAGHSPWNKGQSTPEEVRERQRAAAKNRAPNAEHKAKAIAASVAVTRGRPLSEEHRAKVSATRSSLMTLDFRYKMSADRRRADAAAGRRVIGPHAPDSRRGIEYRLWRKAVLERDGYRCVRCGKGQESVQIHAHHIKSYAEHPELRLDVANGQALCEACHRTEPKCFTSRKRKRALSSR